MKEERNRNETQHVQSLKQDFQHNIKTQENCFRKFSEYYQVLKDSCKINEITDEISNIIQLSALDKWAFWLDTFNSQGFQHQSQDKLLQQLDLRFRDLMRKASHVEKCEILEKAMSYISSSYSTTAKNTEVLISMVDTPARRVALAKLIANSKGNDAYTHAEQIFDELIEQDEFWYPSAHYYKAYILVNKTNDIPGNKNSILREFIAAEKIITQHVDMQMSFIAVVGSISGKGPTAFHPIDAYKKQKENNVYLFELFNNSISNILGGHCQKEDLSSVGIDESKAEMTFNALLDNQFVTFCQNIKEQIPDYEQTIEKIAFDYGVCPQRIEIFINSVQGQTERELEKRLNKDDIFEWTRKTFWAKCVQLQVLTEAVDVFGMEKGKAEELELCLEKQVSIDENHIWYNPSKQSPTEIENKVFFPKTYIKEYLEQKYQSEKKELESNKLACINRENLILIQTELWGRVQLNDFKVIGLEQSDSEEVFTNLVSCGIIDNDGKIKNFTGKWEFPNCPLYEDEIITILQKKSSINFICKEWLDPKSPNQSAITLLPMKPSRGLLDDLFSSRLIVPPSVPDNDTVNLQGDGVYGFLKNKVWSDDFHEKFPDSKDRDSILSYLRGKQASYANLETPQATLKSLRHQLKESQAGARGQKVDNINTELAIFGLIGFDEIVDLNEQKWSFKMILRSAVVIVVGLAQVFAGAMIGLYSAGMMTHVSAGLLSEGISDIIFALSALRSGNNFTFGDYGRHKIESIAITACSIGVGCLLSRGVKFFKYGFKVAGPALQGASQSTSVVALGFREAAKEAAKITLLKVAKSASVSLLNQGVHIMVSQTLRSFCQQIATKLLDSINEKLKDIQNLRETLANLYKKHGSEAEKKVSETLNDIFSPSGNSWISATDHLFSQVVSALSTGIEMALEKRESASIASKIVNVASKISTCTLKVVNGLRWLMEITQLLYSHFASFQNGLNSQIKESQIAVSEKDISEKETEEFVNNAVGQFNTQLCNQAGQMVEKLTTILLQSAANIALEVTIKSTKKIYKQHKENQLRKEFQKLKSDEDNRRQFGQSNENQGTSKEYTDACLKLMKKTRYFYSC